jgi:hypothetical protein
VDEHYVERSGLRRSGFDHPLEFGPAVVRCGRTRLDIVLDELVAARGAIGFTLPALVWNGDVVLGLPRRRDAQIEGGAQGHGHGKTPLRLSARPKQFIKEVAEPRFEHVNLGLRDRHALGPIVGDGPSREIVLRRPAEARPRLGRDVKIVW